MPTRNNTGDQTAARLNAMTVLLQDIFILQAVEAGISPEAVRRLLSIDKKRVNRISKHLPREARSKQR